MSSEKITALKQIYNQKHIPKILFSLTDGNKTNSELVKITGCSPSSISQYINKLKNSHFIEEEDGKVFHITQIGKIIISQFKEKNILKMKRLFEVIQKFEPFWANHFLEEIPESLLNNIGDLYHSEIIRDTSSESSKALHNYFMLLRKARQVFVVSSMTSIDLCHAVIELLNKGILVEVVITNDVLETLSKEPFIKIYHELIQFSNFKLMVTEENAKIALTVTDNFISFGLYQKTGIAYDFSEDMIGLDTKSIEWGKKVFQYYKDKSVIKTMAL